MSVMSRPCRPWTVATAILPAGLAAAILSGVPAAAEPAAAAPDIFARKNLVAWCIVPFDGKERSPAERGAMLEELGITRVAVAAAVTKARDPAAAAAAIIDRLKQLQAAMLPARATPLP